MVCCKSKLYVSVSRLVRLFTLDIWIRCIQVRTSDLLVMWICGDGFLEYVVMWIYGICCQVFLLLLGLIAPIACLVGRSSTLSYLVISLGGISPLPVCSNMRICSVSCKGLLIFEWSAGSLQTLGIIVIPSRSLNPIN